MNNQTVDEAWESFREDRNIEARNQLMLHYSGLVKMVAAKVGSTLPNMVDRDDLISYGMFGLMDTLESYDPGRGVRFESFATSRIRGSIIDELRKLDRVPRSVRSKIRELTKVRANLQAKLGRDPTDQEAADLLGVTINELWLIHGEMHTSTIDSIDQDDDRPASSLMVQDITANPEDLFAVGEITELVAETINQMPERYKTILVLYYIHEMTLAQIGEVLGVTESRVCQLQSKVLIFLRDTLGHGTLSAA